MTKLRHVGYLLFPISALLSVACGSDTASESRANPLVCSKNWEVVYSVEQGLYGQEVKFLQWHDGRLYFREIVDSNYRIRSLGGQDKETSVVLESYPNGPFIFDFWIESDKILYTDFNDLYSRPLVGGAAEVVFHRPSSDAEDFPYYIGSWALDDEALYWIKAEHHDDWNLWKGLRGKNEEKLLATLGDVYVKESFARGDSIFLRGGDDTGQHAWVIPKTGGEARELTRTSVLGPNLLGISENGVFLWANTKDDKKYTIIEVSADGGAPKPFWTSLPEGSWPLLARADGSGGWCIVLWEHGTDDAIHSTIWLVDSAGHQKRLGCDPEVQALVSDAVVAPEGLYLVAHTQAYTHIALIRR